MEKKEIRPKEIIYIKDIKKRFLIKVFCVKTKEIMHNRVLKKVDKNKRNCINFSLYGD